MHAVRSEKSRGVLAGALLLGALVVTLSIGPAQGNSGLDAVSEVDCNPSQTYGDAGDSAAAAALAAQGYTCTALLNKGPLGRGRFEQVGEIWHKLDGSILRMRVIFFGGTNTGFTDAKVCLDDDPNPINNVAPGGQGPTFCEGSDTPLSFAQGGDNGPSYPPAKAAGVAPEEPNNKMEIRIDSLVEISEVFGGTTVGGWNINIDGYTEVLPHFNKGSFSTVAYFQPVPPTGAVMILKQSTKGGNPLVANPGATFSVDGPDAGTDPDFTVRDNNTSPAGSVNDEDATVGEVCVSGLAPGTYTVNETGAPAGYGGASQSNVTATAPGGTDCASSQPAGANRAAFTNAPLGEFIINYNDLGSGETATDISCTNLTPSPADTTPGAFDDDTETYTNLPPGTYNCTIVVDP